MNDQIILSDTSVTGVRTITLNRPARLNAVDPALAEALPREIEQAAGDDAVRVIVIIGAGRAFCAGLDLTNPAGLTARSRHDRLDPLAWVGRWVLALTSCEKPVIAAVNGVAAGAGLGLALAADVRLIAQGTSVTAGYVRRGLSPDAGVSYFLPRLVGLSRAADILLTGRDVSADEAERIGLVSQVLPADGFADRVAAYAQALAAGPPVAHALTKRVLLASLGNDLRSQLELELTSIKTAFATRDVREAIAAFGEKRPPVFTGE